MSSASTYMRVNERSGSICRGLPDLAGTNGARLVLKSDGEAVGPPAGATRYSARWHKGSASGDAEILVMPFSSWGSEVHVSVHSPRTLLGALAWRRWRLSQLSAHLATAVKEASVRPKTARRTETADDVASARWLFAPAGKTSAAR